MSQAITEELARLPMSPNLAVTLTKAADYAREQGHSRVTLEHLLLALTEDPDASLVLKASNVAIDRLTADASTYLASLERSAQGDSAEQLMLAVELRRVLEAAAAAAQQGRRTVTGAIVLAAIFGEGKSTGAQMLRAHGLTFESAIKALQRATRPGPAASASAPAPQAPPPRPQQAPSAPPPMRAAAPPSEPSPPAQPPAPAPPPVKAVKVKEPPVEVAPPVREPPPQPAPAPPPPLAPPPRMPPVQDAQAALEPMRSPPVRDALPHPQQQGQPYVPPPVGPLQPEPPLPPPEQNWQRPPQPARQPMPPMPPAELPPPQPRTRPQPPRDAGSRRPAPATGEAAGGQLVENIPRSMRVAVPVTVEVRLLTGDLGAYAEQQMRPPTRAMAVRLSSPRGGFRIEAVAPETQWIEGPASADGQTLARWRWTVTPEAAGHQQLQLAVSARWITPEGISAEMQLPEQTVDVRVRRNSAVAVRRTSGWLVAAGVGALIAMFGGGIWTLVVRLLNP